jgi:hypothetical protein
MIKPKPWERVMRVHYADERTVTVCRNYIYNPKITNVAKEVTCKKCLLLMDLK